MQSIQNSSTPDFILLGEGNYNTLGVLHQLGEIGISPLILSVGKTKNRAKGNLIGYSRRAKRIVEIESETAGLDWILSHKDEFASGTIIYPTSDKAELLLDSNYDNLSIHFRFPNGGAQGAIGRLMDKQQQTDLARNAGLRILDSQYTTSADFSIDKVKFPCMVKPLNSTRGSKGDMKVCHDELSLTEALNHGRFTTDFIVQQYIENEADLLFLGVSFSDGNVWLPAVVVKPGVSAIGEYTHAIISTDVDKYLPEKENVIRFVKRLGYVGPFSIEFGHEKGLNYFFEINLRNDGTSHYPLNAGINIAQAYITDTLPTQEPTSVTYNMIDEVGDMRRVLNGELSLGAWIKAFRNAGTYRFYRKGDYPLIPQLFGMFTTRTISKIYRSIAHNR